LNTCYEAIRISSGNSFVLGTESQVILNGSRDINFTMDLVIKDVGLFDALARELNVPLELSALIVSIDGVNRYESREFSPNIIRRLEDACGVRVLGEGFPAQMVDHEPKVPGYEVTPQEVIRQLHDERELSAATGAFESVDGELRNEH
jgi:3-hydroxyisobutyrate dehydrogenase